MGKIGVSAVRHLALLGASFALVSSHMPPRDDHEGVRMENMMEYLGATGHATCLRSEIQTVSEDRAALAAAIRAAVDKCRDHTRSLFDGAKLNGGSFPLPMIQQAMRMRRKVEDYLLPQIEALPADPRPLKDRMHFVLVEPDGNATEAFAVGDDNSSGQINVPEVSYLTVRFG